MADRGRRWFTHALSLTVASLVVGVGAMVDASAATVTTKRLSVSSSGSEGNGASFDNVLSATGRFLVFTSAASNLVGGDSNGTWDVFLRDRRDGKTRRVSVNSNEAQGNGTSEWPSVSRDGRFVAFESDATNLVGRDTNAARDIFVRDRATGTTSLVSKSSGGGRGNGTSYDAAISTDGRFVAFASDATNLVPGDTNAATDVFVRDLLNGITVRVSKSSSGTPSDDDSYLPVISADGRFVAFVSGGSTLVANDLNALDDIFIRDRLKGITKRVSVASDGSEADGQSGAPSISADGRVVAFESDATNLVGGQDTNGYRDVFVRDRAARTTTRVSMNTGLTIQGNGDSEWPSISGDGRLVAFHSSAEDLVGGQDTNGWQDVFVHDRELQTTSRVSVNTPATIQGNGDSNYAAISSNGRFVSFQSEANDLVGDDLNGQIDVFIRGPLG